MNDSPSMRTRSVPATETRFPQPEPGEAIVISKYRDQRRKAVILHPDDFDLFERYRRIFGREPHEMQLTDTAIAAHRAAEHGGEEATLDLDSLDRAPA
jgi:hypothetical protein